LQILFSLKRLKKAKILLQITEEKIDFQADESAKLKLLCVFFLEDITVT
jgi:hypothetical protein